MRKIVIVTRTLKSASGSTHSSRRGCGDGPRSSVGSAGHAAASGVVSQAGHHPTVVGGTFVTRHRITRGGSEVSEDDSIVSAPAGQ